MGLDDALQRKFVGGGNLVGQCRCGNPVEALDHGHIAEAGRRPVELSNGNMLFSQVIAEHGDTDVDDIQWLVKQ
ncbi:hypothetical protein D3C87_2124810 [compost metagenome]